MVAHVHCEILLGIRNWSEICYLPHLRCRDLSSPNQRSLSHAIPNVDSIWHNAWIRRRSSLLQSFRHAACQGTKLAVDDGICHAPRRGSLLLCVYGTRIAALGTLHARHPIVPDGKSDQLVQYMSKGRHYKAYESMVKLRYNKVQAARDVFYMHTLLEAEEELKANKKNIALELITVPRNRRALIASEIVMFMQQVRPQRFFFPSPLSNSAGHPSLLCSSVNSWTSSAASMSLNITVPRFS